MAGYKAHMAFGIFTAVAWSVFLLFVSVISYWLVPCVLLLTLIGAFLPDLDSDTGLPLRVLLIISSLLVCSIVGYFFVEKGMEIITLLASITLTYIFIYYFVGGLIKKITRHRGIFHSIPAVLLSFLLTLTLLNHFDISVLVKIILSLSVGVGYLSHLILDEMNSIVNLEGMPFIPKRSLGTALKFYSNEWKVSVFIYLTITYLVIHNWSLFKIFFY